MSRPCPRSWPAFAVRPSSISPSGCAGMPKGCKDPSLGAGDGGGSNISMAVRGLLAALVGGLLLMVWGQFYWFVLPTEDIIHHSPEEQRLLSTMQEAWPASGGYILPPSPAGPSPARA